MDEEERITIEVSTNKNAVSVDLIGRIIKATEPHKATIIIKPESVLSFEALIDDETLARKIAKILKGYMQNGY